MNRPNCAKCKAELTGHVRYHWTACPSCGRRWQLTEDNSEIRSVTLTVQSGRHGVATQWKVNNGKMGK